MLPGEGLMRVSRGRESKAVGRGLVPTNAPWDWDGGFGYGISFGPLSSTLRLQPGPGRLETVLELGDFILDCLGL